MVQIKPVLDAYIDVNILLTLAFLLWLGARLVLNATGLRHAYRAQLGVLNAVLIAVAMGPLLAPVMQALAGYWTPHASLNASDALVAYYLNGGFQMSPGEFETMMSYRSHTTRDFLMGGSPLLLGVAGLLITGSVLCIARLLRNIVKLNRLVGRAHLWRRMHTVDIRISDQIHIPFSTRGLRRRIIVIPSAMLAEPDHLKLSLAHEFQHLRNGDIEWELALELLRPLAFWNPVFVIWKREVERLRELTCDQDLITRKGVDPRRYMSCLIDVCLRSVKRDGSAQIAMPQVGLVGAFTGYRRHRSMRELQQRLMAVASDPVGANPKLVLRYLAPPLIIGLAVLSLSIQRTGDWSHDRLMLSTIVNLERLEHLNTLANPYR
jgi:beta-lactamase regulating signal transducer with metallopeptidase domain